MPLQYLPKGNIRFQEIKATPGLPGRLNVILYRNGMRNDQYVRGHVGAILHHSRNELREGNGADC